MEIYIYIRTRRYVEGWSFGWSFRSCLRHELSLRFVCSFDDKTADQLTIWDPSIWSWHVTFKRRRGGATSLSHTNERTGKKMVNKAVAGNNTVHTIYQRTIWFSHHPPYLDGFFPFCFVCTRTHSSRWCMALFTSFDGCTTAENIAPLSVVCAERTRTFKGQSSLQEKVRHGNFFSPIYFIEINV